jgi:hypothetical protein
VAQAINALAQFAIKEDPDSRHEPGLPAIRLNLHAIMSSGGFAVDSLLSRITVTPGTRSDQPCIRDLRIGAGHFEVAWHAISRLPWPKTPQEAAKPKRSIAACKE